MDNYKQMKKFQTIIVSCMLFFVALIAVTVVSFVQVGKVRKQNAEYDALIEALSLQKESLSSDINSIDFEKNPNNLDELARNEFGMIKNDEAIYIFK